VAKPGRKIANAANIAAKMPNTMVCCVSFKRPIPDFFLSSDIIPWLILNCKPIPDLRQLARAQGYFPQGDYSKVWKWRDLA
jgi:hypothetical protein